MALCMPGPAPTGCTSRVGTLVCTAARNHSRWNRPSASLCGNLWSSMELEIVSLVGPLCVVIVDTEWSLQNLREAIESETGISPGEQTLLADYVILSGAQTLLSDLLPDGCTSVLCICSAGWCVLDYSSSEAERGLLQPELLSIDEAKLVCSEDERAWGFTFELDSEDAKCILYDNGLCHISRHHTGGRTYVRYNPAGRRALLEVIRRVKAPNRGPFLRPIKDLETILAIVEEDHASFRHVGYEFRSNAQVVHLAVTANGFALAHAADFFKDDERIVRAAVQQNAFALQYAGPALRGNRDIVSLAIESAPSSIRYASDAMRNDKELCLQVVRKDPYALKHVGPECKADREVVAAAVNQEADSVQFASSSMQSDNDIIELARSKGYSLGDVV